MRHIHDSSPTCVIESPYAGDIERNTTYARRCMRNAIVEFNEAHFASHLLYTQPTILDDTITEERADGITCGFIWAKHANTIAFYIDYGFSPGMIKALERCVNLITNRPKIFFRRIGTNENPTWQEPTSGQ